MAKKGIRFISLLCVFALMIGMCNVPVYAETAAEKYKRLKDELAALSGQIENAQNAQEQASARQTQLAEQKRLIEEAIVAKQEIISQTETDLAAKQEEVAVTRQTILEQDQLFQARLVALYKMNNSNAIAQMLSVDSLSDFITVTDSMKRISENDTNLLNNLNNQREQLETQQAEIDASLAQLEADKTDLENDTASLATSISQANAALTQAQADEAAGKAAYDDTKQQAEKAYQEMLAASKSASSAGSQKGDGSTYVGGVFLWPVPGHYKITCNFGDADPSGRKHNGMDISGNQKIGADIIAAGKGKVITAYWNHSSYGNYVVIDHGNGTKTLYAHCSALYVQAGQEVEAGTVIAALGSTGYSTGPHLHFEVLDPSRTDPRPYLRG